MLVPIEYSLPPANLLLSEDRLSEARLLLERPASVLDILTPSQVRLKVKPHLIGKLQDGYKVQEIEITPALVDVIVPVEKESSQKELLTTPIYLQGIKSSSLSFAR